MSENKPTKDLGALWGAAYAGRSGPFVKVPADVIGRLKQIGLTANEVLLVIVLVSFLRDDRPGELPYPGIDTLAKLVGSDPATVKAMVNKLDQAGLIKVQRGEKGRGRSNRYDLGPLLAQLAEPTCDVSEEDNNLAQELADVLQHLEEAKQKGDTVLVDELSNLLLEMEAELEASDADKSADSVEVGHG